MRSSIFTPSIIGIGAITVPTPCFDGTPGVKRVIVGLSNINFAIFLLPSFILKTVII